MGVFAYVKSIATEFAVLLVSAFCLSFTLANGFKAADGFEGLALVGGGVCVVLLAALYAAARSSRTLVPGSAAIAVATVAALVAAIAAGGGANVFEDASGNVLIVGVAAYLATLLAFVATRFRVGCAAYAVAGCIAIALIEFLFEAYLWAPAVAFPLAAIMLIVVRNYRIGLKGTASKRVSFLATSLMALAAALIAGLVAAAVFFLVVAPLNPPALEPKLLTEYLALEEIPRRGTNAELAVTNPDMTSALTNDSLVPSSEGDDRDKDTSQNQGAQDNPLTGSLQTFGSAIGYNIESATEAFNVITYNVPWYGWILIVLAVAAVLALPWGVKLLLRRRFYEKALQRPVRDYVVCIYERIVRDFERIGIQHTTMVTPYEFALACEREVADFANNPSRTNFMTVTYVFVKAGYASEALTAEELVSVHDFYRSFHKNCRAHLGTLKYLRKFFRL